MGPKISKGHFTVKLDNDAIKCNSALEQLRLKEALPSFLRLGYMPYGQKATMPVSAFNASYKDRLLRKCV